MKALTGKLLKPFRRRRGSAITFTGDYPNWEAARKDAGGFDAAAILDKTRAALLKVKNGEAVYERDAVLFDQIQHSFPLLAGLLRAALDRGGELCVLDYGGALGSSYFQCRAFLAPVKKLSWLVVEQAGHVACGKKDFETNELRFYPTVADCLQEYLPNVVLLSAVLHYLPDPYTVLATLLNLKIEYVIIDRTPFLLGRGRERLMVQHVPSAIYEASYPAWFFDERKLTSVVLAAGYRMVAEFDGFDKLSPPDEKACCRGFIFRKLGHE